MVSSARNCPNSAAYKAGIVTGTFFQLLSSRKFVVGIEINYG